MFYHGFQFFREDIKYSKASCRIKKITNLLGKKLFDCSCGVRKT